jgi:hypothetical protein
MSEKIHDCSAQHVYIPAKEILVYTNDKCIYKRCENMWFHKIARKMIKVHPKICFIY